MTRCPRCSSGVPPYTLCERCGLMLGFDGFTVLLQNDGVFLLGDRGAGARVRGGGEARIQEGVRHGPRGPVDGDRGERAPVRGLPPDGPRRADVAAGAGYTLGLLVVPPTRATPARVGHPCAMAPASALTVLSFLHNNVHILAPTHRLIERVTEVLERGECHV
jgi:hypothetical protein